MDTNRLSRRSLIRALGMGAGLTLAAPILAACGQPAAPAPTAAPAKPAEPAKPAAPAAPTTASAAAAQPAVLAGKGDQPIVLWSGQLVFEDQSVAMGRWATSVRNTFADQNPKYTLKVEDHGWDQPLRTGLLTAIAGGTVPEVTTGEAFVHEFASLGAFLPVPDLTEKDFVYGSIAGSLYKGQLYGVPIYTSAFALETNVRVAQKAGLDPNKPPKTWAELIENSEKAFKAGSGNFVGYNLYGPAPNRVYGTVLRSPSTSPPTSSVGSCSRRPTRATPSVAMRASCIRTTGRTRASTRSHRWGSSRAPRMLEPRSSTTRCLARIRT